MPVAALVSAPADVRRARAAALLAVALTLHDLEEALGYPVARPKLLALWPSAPPATAFWAALVVVTVAGLALTLWAGSRPPSRGKALGLRAVAWVLLANVLVPHVPAAFVLGGYAPGLVTAVAVNLPACLLALRLLRGI